MSREKVKAKELLPSSQLLRLNVEKTNLNWNKILETNGIEMPEYAYMQRLDEIAARARQKIHDGATITGNLPSFPWMILTTTDPLEARSSKERELAFKPQIEAVLELDGADYEIPNVQYIEYQAIERERMNIEQLRRRKLKISGYDDVSLSVNVQADESIAPLVFVCTLKPVHQGIKNVTSLIVRFSRTYNSNNDAIYEIDELAMVIDDSFSTMERRTRMFKAADCVREAFVGSMKIDITDMVTHRKIRLPYNAEQLATFVTMKIAELQQPPQRQHLIKTFPVFPNRGSPGYAHMYVKKPYVLYTLTGLVNSEKQLSDGTTSSSSEHERGMNLLNLEQPITSLYYPEGNSAKSSMTTMLTGVPRYSVGRFIGCLYYSHEAATYIILDLDNGVKTAYILTYNSYLDIDYTASY